MTTKNRDLSGKIRDHIIKVERAILARKVSVADGKLYIEALKKALSRAQ